MYNYVDPTGSLVTVNYKAGPEGFTQERSVEAGTVVMRNVPVGYSGPLAGVDDVKTGSGVITSSRQSSSGMSQSDLIARIISSLQPRISSAVQSAIGSSSFDGARRTVTRPAVRIAPRPVVLAPAPIQNQDSVIRSVINSLQPRITSAVNSALSSSSRSVGASSVGGNIASRFGTGASVLVETPQFTYST